MSIKQKTILVAGGAIIAILFGMYFFLSASAKIREVTPPVLPAAPATSTTNFTLSVGDAMYHAHIPADTTVIGAMNILSSTTSFTFTGREYPSLGFFVDSINGKKNNGGLYWFLYVNGKSSETGASATTLHDGDIVEWRYEKNH